MVFSTITGGRSMKEKIFDFILEENPNNLMEMYLEKTRFYLSSLPKQTMRRECVSGLNRYDRKGQISSEAHKINLRPGDIVYCDFGQAYLNEIGFQHFALIIAIFQYKAFVVPMSSNYKTICKAPNYPGSCHIKEHLYYIGKPKGLNKESVLFLNDAKFINTARVIEVKGHLETKEKLFKQIKYFYYKMFE